MLATMPDVAQTPPMGSAEPSPDVAKAASGDRVAFERLYRTHLSRVYSICVRMREKLPQFRGESAFPTWLHRLAVNVALNDRVAARRERSRAAAGSDNGEDDVDAWPDTSAAPRHAERMDLEAAIAM